LLADGSADVVVVFCASAVGVVDAAVLACAAVLWSTGAAVAVVDLSVVEWLLSVAVDAALDEEAVVVSLVVVPPTLASNIKSRFENDTHGGSTHGKIAVIVVCNRQTDAAPGAAKTTGWRWNKTDFSYERALGSSHSHRPPHSPLFIQHTS
jgi:hypothetical protein